MKNPSVVLAVVLTGEEVAKQGPLILDHRQLCRVDGRKVWTPCPIAVGNWALGPEAGQAGTHLGLPHMHTRIELSPRT